MKLRTISLTIAALGFAAPALAHHSFAMFDVDKKATVNGTVKQLEWGNPHVWLHVLAMDKDGKPQEWSFEMGSIGQVSAEGWKPSLVKPGDKISIVMHPLKDGSRGGQYLAATLANGRNLHNGQNREKEVNQDIPQD